MDIKQLFPTNPISGATMTEQQALLASVITSPDDDTPRSMYADFLQDSDDTLDRKLGEYIKLSLELANHKKLMAPRKDEKIKNIEYRNDWYDHPKSYDWYQRGIELQEQINELWKVVNFHTLYDSYTTRDLVAFEVDRGFINSITCTASQFLSVCDKLIWHPSMVDTYAKKGKHIKKGQLVYAMDLDIVPRPCPLSAHPVREVEITNVPSVMTHLSKIHKWAIEFAPLYSIKFTYPPTPT